MTEAATLLALCDAAEGRPETRALRLLRAAGEREPEALDLDTACRRLLHLEQATVGGVLESLVSCPACGVRNALAIDPAALSARPADGDVVRVEVAGHRVDARPPTLGDFAAAAATGDETAAAALLLERSVVRTEPATPAAELAPEVVAAVEAALDAAYPLADPRIEVTCETCGVATTVAFEAAEFLAAELAVRGRRTMAEVATLARAFGWSEREILALPASRRRVYLELAW